MPPLEVHRSEVQVAAQVVRELRKGPDLQLNHVEVVDVVEFGRAVVVAMDVAVGG